jgi:carbamoyl-phosphate synthase large subunit
MQLCILLTSVGGMVSPGMIDNLRNIGDVGRVIGTDVSAKAIGFHFVDKACVVPRGDSPDYFAAIADLARKHSVDVIIPCSDEEVLTLSRHKGTLKQNGTAVICSSYETTSVAIDKGTMLGFLKTSNTPVPFFFLPTSKSEFMEAARTLGYPSKPVAVKPRKGRGGRGFWVLREKIDLLGMRNSQETRLNWYLDTVPEHRISEVVMMEFLPGQDYSVDVLAVRGLARFIVPRKRIRAVLGPSQIGEVVWDPVVVRTVETITEKFGFDAVVNIQLKCPGSAQTAPLIYEINPRISGTIVASTAAGVDLLHYGIRHALGLDMPKRIEPYPIKMTRYFKEYFEHEGQSAE